MGGPHGPQQLPEWNPLLREAAGEIAVGKRLTFRTFPANGRPMTIRPRVLAAEPGAELRWMARIPGIIGGEHSFTLSPRTAAPAWSERDFRGILVPFSGKSLASSEGSFVHSTKHSRSALRTARGHRPRAVRRMTQCQRMTAAPANDCSAGQ